MMERILDFDQFPIMVKPLHNAQPSVTHLHEQRTRKTPKYAMPKLNTPPWTTHDKLYILWPTNLLLVQHVGLEEKTTIVPQV